LLSFLLKGDIRVHIYSGNTTLLVIENKENMKTVFGFLIILGYFSSLLSRNTDSPWNVSLSANLTCALNALSQNYSGNSAGSFVWIATADPVITRKFGQTAISKNSFKIGFGQTKIQDKNTKNWSSPVKTTDFISFNSTLKFTTQHFKSSYLSFKINSQFIDDLQEKNRRYLNPVEFKESFGISRSLFSKKEFNWKIDFGGALRQGVDRHVAEFDSAIFSNKYSNNLEYDGGFEFGSEIAINRNSWLSITSKFYTYQALFRPSGQKLKSNDWRYPDIKWDSSVKVYLTSFFAFNYMINLTYNKDLDSDPFIKQIFGASLSFNYLQ